MKTNYIMTNIEGLNTVVKIQANTLINISNSVEKWIKPIFDVDNRHYESVRRN